MAPIFHTRGIKKSLSVRRCSKKEPIFSVTSAQQFASVSMIRQSNKEE